MSIFFDEVKREIFLSVGDLISPGEKVKIGFSGNEGYKRLWVGQSMHLNYQESQIYIDKSYQKEVIVKGIFEIKGWKVQVQGRVDGIRRQEGKIIVEEIKTIHFKRDLPQFYESETFEIYKKQLDVYCYLIYLNEKREVEGRLILLDIGTFDKKIFEREISPQRMESFILNKLKKIISSYERNKEKLEEEKISADQIPFIFPTYRKYQRELIGEIEYALENKKNILISAPTGIGKTVSAITPAIKFCLKKNLKLFFLTSKTTQQEMAVEVLKKINYAGSFRSIQIRAKEKMCASKSLLCHERFCLYAKDYGKKKEESGILLKILNGFYHFEPDLVYNLSKKEELCPFEISLELMSNSKAVVCDYNYIFDPYVSFFEWDDSSSLSNCVLIIDEAHNLTERGRSYWSPEIKKNQIVRAIERILFWQTEASEIIKDGLGIILNYFEKLEKTNPFGEVVLDIDFKVFRDSLSIFETQILEYFSYLKEQEILPPEEPFLEFYFNYIKFCKVLNFLSKRFKVIFKKSQGDCAIKIFCLDPAPFLKERISSSYSTIAMSATLEPSYFYKRILGFSQGETIEANFPSPFPKENRKVIIYPFIDTTYKKRSAEAPLLAKLLYEMGNCVSGNFLILFPSYDYLKEILNYFNEKGKKILVQRKEQELKETIEIMNKIKGKRGNYLFFGVSGGMFAEGVDYPEEVIKGVFIISPSLPQVSLEQELLKEYYDEMEENGFSYAYLIPGITRVIQSAGRVIRSEKDKGVIVLICRRFSEKKYFELLPRYWYEEKIEELITKDPIKEIKKFLGGKGGKKKAIPYS